MVAEYGNDVTCDVKFMVPADVMLFINSDIRLLGGVYTAEHEEFDIGKRLNPRGAQGSGNIHEVAGGVEFACSTEKAYNPWDDEFFKIKDGDENG